MIKKNVSVFFVFYWLITLLYNLPSNPIKIKTANFIYDFGLFFSQNWSFFAPPPQSNNKLYYSFFDKDKKSIDSFEVLEIIFKEKKDKLPFNIKEEITDYVISGSVNQLFNVVIHTRNKLKFEDNNQKNIQEYDRIAIDDLRKNINNFNEFKTLVNFSKILAHNLYKENSNKISYLKIIITEKPIPKFYNRYQETNNLENIVIETDYVKF